MTSSVLAIAAAYVAIGVLLLGLGLTSRLAWWIKAAAIVVTSVFFIEAFFATKSLLGWPSTDPLPARFQVLWLRPVEPDSKTGDPGAVYLWIEEIDENNVPSGQPRSYKLPYTRPLAERAVKARDEIMKGRPQQGAARDFAATQAQPDVKIDPKAAVGARPESGGVAVDADQFKLLRDAQQVEFGPMPTPALPLKLP